MNYDNRKYKKAVVFGAGKMACGLLGQLLFQSGFNTLFVARQPAVLNAINRWNGYTLDISGEQARSLSIRNCTALSIREEYRVIEEVAGADVVFTALGINNISAVTPLIAEGLWIRRRMPDVSYLNVIACENLPGAGDYLRHQVLNSALMKKTILIDHVGGFSAGLTHRIMTGGSIGTNELVFSSDSDFGLTIDTRGLKGGFPDIKDVTFTDEFPVMVMRKLFTINFAQAIAAYLGHREGCHYIHEAAVHPRVMPVLTRAMEEVMAALKAELPRYNNEIEKDIADALKRISNAELYDTVDRVARDPRRKLSPRERLVGPALLARQHNLPHENICQGIAAAISYDNPKDSQAIAMQHDIKVGGLEKILTEECGLLPYDPLSLTIKRIWRDINSHTNHDPKDHPLVDVIQHLSMDFDRDYDPDQVKVVLVRAYEEFRDVHIRNYLPMLIKKRVSELLRETHK